MIQNKIINLLISIFLLILLITVIATGQTKKADVFPAGGGQSENTQYKNFGTFGQPSAGSSANSSYKNNEGFLNAQDSPVCTNPTDGGEIANDQTICYDTAPAEIESTSLPTGHFGDLEYKWQFTKLDPEDVDFEDSDWNDIASSNAVDYQPEELTETTWYRRLARVDCESDWSGAIASNVVKVTVRPQFTSGAINSTGETICYNTNPSTLIGSTTDASGGDETITYSWYSSADNYKTAISGADEATYTPAGPLTASTSYRRLAKDDICNTTATQSTGEWTVTVNDVFTTGSIATTGQTFCLEGNPSEIGSLAPASGGDGDIVYQWQSSTTGESEGFADISGADDETFDPPSGLEETTWYCRLAKDGTCNTTFTASTGVWKVQIKQSEVFISESYNSGTTGWQTNHFDNLSDALAATCGDEPVVNISGYNHTGNVNMSGYTFIIGNEDFVLNGTLSGGLIQATGGGKLLLPAVQNATRTFPVTDGTINFTLLITPLSGSTSGFIGVKLNTDKEVTGALKSPTTFWDLYGNENLNATVVLRLEKSVLDGTVIPENAIMRFWNGTRYAPIPSERTTIVDSGSYYEITLTGINYFNVNF